DRLARPLGILDGDEPNLLWFTFSDDRARSAYTDWDDVADDQVADLHAEHYGNTDAEAIADRLEHAAGAAFTDRWARVAVARKPTGVRGLRHPEVGLLRLAFETLELRAPTVRAWSSTWRPTQQRRRDLTGSSVASPVACDPWSPASG
ncbi:MAG: hypothetical protein M3396_11150, partial [Actinomycetota bacterium]|nr:hypothetical protein [Actinomycetota bacterium]